MLNVALTRLAKGSLIYGIGGMLQRFMVVLLLPVFTNVLTPEDYGIVALVSLVSVATAGIFNLGTANSMGVLYFEEHETSKRHSIIWSNIFLLILNGALWYTILYYLSPALSGIMFQSDINAHLIRLALFGSFVSVVADPLLAYLRMEEKALQYIALTGISSFLSIVSSILLVLVYRLGVEGMILASTITQVAMLLINLCVIGRKLYLKIDVSRFIPLVRIGFPSIFGLLAFLIIDYADRQMIGRMVGFDALGIYSIGCSFGLFMNLATGAFATSWPPFFMSYVNKVDEARSVFAQVLTYYLLSFGILTVLFFVFAKPVVEIMTAQQFHQAQAVVGLVAACMFLKGCYLIILPGIYYAKKLHFQASIEWSAALLNIVLNLLFIPIFGITGAALATLLSYVSLPFMTYIISRRYFVVEYEWVRVLKISSLVSTTGGVLFTLSELIHFSVPITLLLNSAIFIIFLTASYYFVLTPSEKQKLISYLP